jgi:hypothetical protein
MHAPVVRGREGEAGGREEHPRDDASKCLIDRQSIKSSISSLNLSQLNATELSISYQSAYRSDPASATSPRPP